MKEREREGEGRKEEWRGKEEGRRKEGGRRKRGGRKEERKEGREERGEGREGGRREGAIHIIPYTRTHPNHIGQMEGIKALGILSVTAC